MGKKEKINEQVKMRRAKTPPPGYKHKRTNRRKRAEVKAELKDIKKEYNCQPIT